MPPEILRLLSDIKAVSDRAYLQLATFDQGGVGIDIQIGARSFEFFCGPLSGNGVSETNEQTLPFTEHDRYFATVGEAADRLLFLVREAARELSSQAA